MIGHALFQHTFTAKNTNKYINMFTTAITALGVASMMLRVSIN